MGSSLIILFITDLNDDGAFAYMTLSAFLVLYYFGGTRELIGDIFTVQNVLLYVVSGFVFASIRAYFKGKELTDEIQKKHYNLKSSVFRWWILFPISALNWIFGKLLKNLYDFVYSKTEKYFNFLFNMK